MGVMVIGIHVSVRGGVDDVIRLPEVRYVQGHRNKDGRPLLF